jgi:hypothetical protein
MGKLWVVLDEGARFENDMMHVQLKNPTGAMCVPLDEFPRLSMATDSQRKKWSAIG